MQEQIYNDIVLAMRAGDKEKLAVLRMIKGAIQQHEKVTNEKLNEQDVIQILNKQIKMRNESIVQFEKGNRQDLVEKTKAEIETINQYLPEQLSEEEIDKIIEQAFLGINPTCQRDIGPLMAVIVPQVKGRADMALINQKIQTRLGDV